MTNPVLGIGMAFPFYPRNVVPAVASQVAIIGHRSCHCSRPAQTTFDADFRSLDLCGYYWSWLLNVPPRNDGLSFLRLSILFGCIGVDPEWSWANRCSRDTALALCPFWAEWLMLLNLNILVCTSWKTIVEAPCASLDLAL